MEVENFDFFSDTKSFELDKNKPLTLILGRVGGEGVFNTITAANRQYKQKHLASSAENWETILHYFNSFQISSVLIKLTPDVLWLFLDENYKSVKEKLFKSISQVPHMVFIYDQIMKDQRELGINEYRAHPSPDNIVKILNWLTELGIDITPYNRGAEVSVLAEAFIANTEKNLIFRLYIPNGRMWSSETDRVLQLFRDYLGRVIKVPTRLDQRRTDQGVIYEFHGETPDNGGSLKSDFDSFSKLMNLCLTDTSAAETILEANGIDHRTTIEILTKYSKEAARLQTDLKHERERKTLVVRQRLESELLEIIKNPADWKIVDSIIDTSIPFISKNQQFISLSSTLQPSIQTEPSKDITINFKPQIIQTINSIVSQEINGDQHLTPEDKKIIELIKLFGAERASDLTSSVHELADASVPQAERLGAKQKIVGFLLEIGRRGTDIAVGVLQTYIEKKMGL
ncbi:hypothetical protein [Pseudomonas protegens]|uniref:hypothetical protein n=1 Tax=Pseudomonas protegens TaxID=380021 RepID=UPI00064217BD|nr:hypothetical protein [Pseudomonas protegens]